MGQHRLVKFLKVNLEKKRRGTERRESRGLKERRDTGSFQKE